MPTFEQIAKELSLTRQKKQQLLKTVLTKRIQSWILKEIRKRLNQKGTDASENRLRTDKAKQQSNIAYSNFTMLLKREKGQPINKVTLKDTGDFYKSFKVIVDDLSFKIDADFLKKNGHIAKNFKDSFGKQEFQNEVIDITPEKFKEMLQNQLENVKKQVLQIS